jgi:hypothetical protein
MKSDREKRHRGKQIKPTRHQIKGYMRLLQDRADQGDVNAAGWLLQLHNTEHLSLRGSSNG